MSHLKEVHDFIAANVAGRSSEELAQMANDRFGTSFTKETMQHYKGNHRLRSGISSGVPRGRGSKTFPKEVADYIIENHKGVSRTEMATQLNERFGTAYTTQQVISYYKNHGLKSGLDNRFKPGQVSPNKGRKGFSPAGTERGWFSKGHTPWNKLPVGSEIVKAGGCLWRKVGEGEKDWKQVHLLKWEEAYGSVPEGHCVIFLDGDRTNCDLANLKLVSKAVHLKMNHGRLRFDNAELTKVGVSIAELKVAASRRKRK